MNETDYPALYHAASAAATDSQQAHLRTVAGLAGSGIVGAALSLCGVTSRTAAILAATVFLAGLGLTLLMVMKNFEAAWYRARAVAESVKTISWRFAMRAEPFESDDTAVAAPIFVRRLKTILSEHRDLAHDFAGIWGDGDHVTVAMTRIRDLPLWNRIALYEDSRIAEQRTWYATKARDNKAAGQRWFAILIALQSAAVVCTLVRIAEPKSNLLPTEVFIVGAAGALAWTQVKRFRELAAAYAVTALEIGLAREDIGQLTSERFSRFVSEMENAFSREHTQWVARKDYR